MKRHHALLLAPMLLAASCSNATATSQSAPVFALDRQAVDGIAIVDEKRADVLPAAVLRSLLQDLLTEHSELSVEIMRQAVDGKPLATSLAELTTNTDALTLAIGFVYGPDGAAAFDQLWTNHIEFFNDYASARGNNDDSAAARAVTELGHYEGDFSSYIDLATSGEAEFRDVLMVLHSHVEQLLAQATAWAAKDYATAYRVSDESYRHMDVIAFALAAGIANQQPDAFTGDPATEAAAACAGLQLAGSLLAWNRAQLVEAENSGVPSQIVAAESALAALERVTLPEIIDRVAAIDSDLTALEKRAALRKALALTDECEGLVLA